MSDEDVAAGSDVEQDVLDDEPKSILLGIISQLRKGMDLSRVTLPTFVLEPRSMCERITDFMSHPELILGTTKKTDPVARFNDVVTYFLSGWHIKPKGVKKPYNPVLGEIFRCRWKFDDGSESFYVCEQVSHHPPISVYFYANPQNDIWISGDLKPKSKFLGNSAATIMVGTSKITFPRTWPGEEYTVTLPNVYARGILFGSMYLELGDAVTIKCPKSDLAADIEFQTKGFFSGTYNGVKGKIKRVGTGEVLYSIGGKWTESMYTTKGASSSAEKRIIFDAATAQIHQKITPPDEAQGEFESRKLWARVTKGINTKNLDYATQEKTAIEDNQRTIVKDRAAKGIAWESRFFTPAGDDWQFRMPKIPDDPVEATRVLEKLIFGPPTNPIHVTFWAEPRRSIDEQRPAAAGSPQ
ncbi:hypothetical protein PhCBS80983_g03089 [Powellomyces hirtus]|uniref:Oxysterol-binding protein n=1 Tax=Powellomyces hirtus TaxID=109895 RepID=A0A507E468_9FUNG|nr:hypothetical protein PhCBS80983_g03089 [Powellomyces hirtus]